ncbi:MAG: hypothetical protein KatS3mg087_1032 [Patescibacteria group bacterium]|nr:MAG: hypothetical protein KatS3mg087_1032 [Patescibacteria group bacterium]
MNSKTYKAELIFSDTDPIPVGGNTGYLGRKFEYGQGFMKTGQVPIIPRDEWDDRIAEQEKTKSRTSDLLRKAGWQVFDQQQTRYCWVFAATAAVEMIRIFEKLSRARLSPASVGCKITQFRNRGGWSTDAIEYISQHGVVPAIFWPPTAISRRYDTRDAWEEAKKYRIVEWLDLQPNTLEEVASALLINIPVAVGYNWWGHAVVAVDLVKIDGKYGFRIANSWGAQWGSLGFGILLGRRAIPDDASAPTITEP